MAKEGNYGSGQVALADERNAQVFDSVALFGLLAMAHRQAVDLPKDKLPLFRHPYDRSSVLLAHRAIQF
jgi:hypothetical protein